ncbi:MAG: alpha/beta hydrolase [Pseudomonadota bacterium]
MRNLIITLILSLGLLGSAAAEVVTLPYQGLTLNANLEKAGASWPAGPVVLLTHGTLAHRGMEIMATLQGLLAERGISSLAINLSLGLDNRAAAMYDCAVPHTHKHTDAVGEIGAWLAWLKGQGAQQVALLGHSRGGNQTARYAAATEDPAVTAVFLLAPQTWDADSDAQGYKKKYHADLFPLLARAERLVAAGKGQELMDGIDFLYCEKTRASAESFLSYHAPDQNMDTPQLIPQIRVPVTVFAGSEDTVVTGLADKVRPLVGDGRVTLVEIDGADHFFRDLYAEDVADTIAASLGVE